MGVYRKTVNNEKCFFLIARLSIKVDFLICETSVDAWLDKRKDSCFPDAL